MADERGLLTWSEIKLMHDRIEERLDGIDHRLGDLEGRFNRLERLQWMFAGGLAVLVFGIQIISKWVR